MVSVVFKWLMVLLLGITLSSAKPALYHPYHVSVVEINHNAADRTLEFTFKIFTDDFEKVLIQNNNKSKVDLINPPDKKLMDSLVKKYVLSHMQVKVNSNLVSLDYIGFERDKEAVFSYAQAVNISSLSKLEINCELMYDIFTDQAIIIHMIKDGKRNSTKLDYPKTSASFSF